MKATVSIPAKLFESADELAAELGIPRSELYARAVEEYVAKSRQADVTARLDEVYATQSSELDPAIDRLQSVSLRSDW